MRRVRALAAWKPYLCLPERSGGDGRPDPVRSTSRSKEGNPDAHLANDAAIGPVELCET
ncbi:hypothetical protein Ga0080559_TMP151 (plasmid) [Salipiger profundus]|uniref:Uncharacterized protein n=1 Tax=Salipiger profundus TaxID=1229727 RepID=A0A1U7DD74_9RHOB|nr:hypothetical protein Ga0080559_TMP151 [Salipiger profundus]